MSSRDPDRSYGLRRCALPATALVCALLFWARLIVVSDLPRTAIADDVAAHSDNRSPAAGQGAGAPRVGRPAPSGQSAGFPAELEKSDRQLTEEFP
jgi:hypothetical protein